ncbi:hypothetical protein RI129_002422 [Pyrocoelia pectoralis]|uniref:Uncharacterized protein n=1 Tax=Pyrocoelia pectoralis TaxID=417401 RepID=A0AAN7VFA2_9COLE
MKIIVIVGILLGTLQVGDNSLAIYLKLFLQIKARNFESISIDTPDVILENILDGKMCSREVGISDSDFKTIEDKDGLLPENNDLLNSFYGCIFKRKGIMDNDGKIDDGNLRIYLSNLFTLNQAITPSQKRLVEDSIKKCRNIEVKNFDQKSVKLINCVMRKLQSVVKE